MIFKKTVLLAAALAASTALQPVPAHARGEGFAVLFGALAGAAAAAAEANAMQQAAMLAAQQQMAMLAAANAAVHQQACLQWLMVVNDQRYDAMTRIQAQQTVMACGIPVPIR